MTGKFSGTLTINMKVGGPAHLLELLGDREEAAMMIEQENFETDFLDRKISLGKFTRKFETMQIKGGRAKLLSLMNNLNKESINVRFVPGSSAKFEDTYFDWLKKPNNAT